MTSSLVNHRYRKHGLKETPLRARNNVALDAGALSNAVYSPLSIINPAMSISHNGTKIFDRLQELLESCNNVKYAAYRMAKKVQLLQSALCWERTKLDSLNNVCQALNLGPTQNKVLLNETELTSLLDGLLSSQQCVPKDEKVVAINLTKEVLGNAFQRSSDFIRLSELKVLLTILCSSKLKTKFLYLFRQFADHNNCVKRKQLLLMLHHVAAIAEFLGEGVAFGKVFLADGVDSCFKECDSALGITEDQFLTWLIQEPQIIVWWSTLYRLDSSKDILHKLRCNSCLTPAFRGLRYECLKCLSFNLCQQCFMLGNSNGKHKGNHPIVEHCTATLCSSRFPVAKSCLNSLWYWLKGRKVGSNKKRYLPLIPKEGNYNQSVLTVDSCLEHDNTVMNEEDNKENIATVCDNDKVNIATFCDEKDEEFWEHLQQIIKTLEQDIKNLESTHSHKHTRQECLLNQLSELHELLNNIQQNEIPKQSQDVGNVFSSTPRNPLIGLGGLSDGGGMVFQEDVISPILSPERDSCIRKTHFQVTSESASLTFNGQQNMNNTPPNSSHADQPSYRVVVQVPFQHSNNIPQTLSWDKCELSDNTIDDCWKSIDYCCYGDDEVMKQCCQMFHGVEKMFPTMLPFSESETDFTPKPKEGSFLNLIQTLAKSLDETADCETSHL